MNEDRRVSKGIRTNIDGTAVTGINGSATGCLKGSASQGSQRRSSAGNKARNHLTISDQHKVDYTFSTPRPDLTSSKHSDLGYAASQSRSFSGSRRSAEANDTSQVNYFASHAKGHHTLEGQQRRKASHSLGSTKNNVPRVAEAGWGEAIEEVSSNVSSEEEEEVVDDDGEVEDEEEPSEMESDHLVMANESPATPDMVVNRSYTSSNNTSSEDEDEDAAAAEVMRQQQIAELKVKRKELRKKVRQLKHRHGGEVGAPGTSTIGKPQDMDMKDDLEDAWPDDKDSFSAEQTSVPHPAHRPYPRSPSPSAYDGPSQESTGGDSPLDLCVKKSDTPSGPIKLQKGLSITLVQPSAVATSTPVPSRSPDRIILSVVPPSSGHSPSPVPKRKRGGPRKSGSNLHASSNQSSSQSHPKLNANLSALSTIQNASLSLESSVLSGRSLVTGSPSVSQMSDSESSLSLSQNSSCTATPHLSIRRDKRRKVEKNKSAENSHHLADVKAAKHQNIESNSSSDSESSGDSGSESSDDTERSATASTASSSTAHASSPMGLKRHHSQKSSGSGRKRRRVIPEERELRIPLEHGWRRQTKIRCFSRSGVRGEVIYYGPCGKKLRNYPEVVRYIQRNGINDLTRDNFCFSTKVNIGDFLERPPGGMPDDCIQISEQEVVARIEEVRRRKGRLGVFNRRIDSRKKVTPEESEKQRKWEEIQIQRRMQQQEITRQALQLKVLKQLEQEQSSQQTREHKRLRAEETRRHKEQQKQSKQQEKAEKLEHLRLEKERQNQQALEEREAKRQQALLREQELQKRREMLMLVDLERERRRQHMMLVRALETRKKQEERDKKREEFLQEREIHRQKKLEQRRMEMQLIREIKKPVDDMMLKETTPLPTLNRIPGLKVSGRAFADLLMVFEFLHNFGESLGFDMDNLPSLNTLQLSVLNYNEKNEEELLSVLHHLLVCAIDDPGVPNPRQNLTVLGHTLRETDITNNNVCEVLRIYVTAIDRNGEICRWLTERPFLSLNPTRKAAVLAFLCNELVCSRIISRQIDNSIDSVNALRKDKWIVEGQLRRLRAVQVRRTQSTKPKDEDGKFGDGDGGQASGKKKKDAVNKSSHDLDDDEDLGNESGNDSDETQETGQLSDAEDEEPEISNEELDKKIDKLARQATQYQNKLVKACHTLRATSLGQDRYRRRYWVLPKAGGIFTEGLESSESVPVEHFSVVDTTTVAAIENPPSEADSTTESKEEAVVVISDSSPAKVKKEEDVTDKTEEGSVVVDEKEAEVVKEEKVELKLEVVKPEPEEVSVKKEGNASPVKKMESSLDLVKPAKEGLSVTQGKNILSGLVDSKVVSAGSPLLGLSPAGVPSVPAHLGGEKNNWLLHSPLFASILASSMFFNSPVMPPGREMNGSFLGNKNEAVTQYNPFMNDFLSPDQFLKSMSDSQAGAQQTQPQPPHKMWFSILPRYPCDKQSLVVNHSKINKTPPKAVAKTESPTVTPSALANLQLGLLNGVPPGILMNSFLAAHGASPLSSQPGASKSPQAEMVSPSMLNHPKRAMLQRMQHDTPLPISLELQRGWWRITDAGQLRTLVEALHHRGIREKNLQKYLQKHLTQLCAICIAGQSSREETDLEITGQERAVSKMPGGAPVPDNPQDWFSEVALRLDLSTLEQVECLEEKVSGASMQIKVSLPLQGWKLPPKLSCDPTVQFQPACTFNSAPNDPSKGQVKATSDSKKKVDKHAVNGESKAVSVLLDETVDNTEIEDDVKKDDSGTEEGALVIDEATESVEDDQEVKPGEPVNPIELAKRRLLKVEAAIERRYLRPPLGTSTELNLASMSSGTPSQSNSRGDQSKDNSNMSSGDSSSSAPVETTPGLLKWRRSVQNCFTSAQLSMCIHALENCIAWDKSIMRASCQFCHNGDNEEKLLLCDGCDKGYHTYCFKPKMDTIPDGDWYCYECLNKATGDKVCVMCGKKGKLLECHSCPKTFHMNCLEPPVTKYPKGKWHCPGCGHKAPKKSSSKSKSSGAVPKEKEHKEPKEKPEKVEKETPKRSSNNSNNSSSEATPTTATPSSEKTKAKEPRKTKEKGNKDFTPCRIVLDELEGSEDAWPFLLPVNTKQFPTYRKVIKKPMDLSTIRNKLESAGYKYREDFVSDVRIIFDNCETFNEDDSPVGIAGHNLRGFFECRWIELTSS